MDSAEYPDALIEQDRQFAESLRDADWTTPVATCPGWTVQQVVRHLGRGHRWAAQIVRERSAGPIDPRQVSGGKPPEGEAGARQWLQDSAATLLRAVEEAGPDTEVWTFLGPRPAAWWIRRRLHESTVHRADGVLALGGPYDLPGVVAADGISEWLDLIVAAPREPAALQRGESLRLQPVEESTGWTIRGGSAGLGWVQEPGEAACTVTGPVLGLFLALTRRRTAEQAGLQVSGDAAIWARRLERTPF